MRVLLTRAMDEATRSAARLAAAGHSASISPLIRIESLPFEVPAESFDALALTSAQAVASGAAARLLARHGATPLWIVGARTLEAARRVGLSGAAIVAPDAAALVAAIAKIAPRPERALYLAGVDRKPTLEAGLAALGVAVTPRECYAAREAAILSVEAEAALREGAVDATLHYSRRSTALFIAAAARAGLAPSVCRHVCLSEDAAGPLRAAGALQISVAAAPTEEALMASLASLASDGG
jgi:uroporphyrinogen-III synthase